MFFFIYLEKQCSKCNNDHNQIDFPESTVEEVEFFFRVEEVELWCIKKVSK